MVIDIISTFCRHFTVNSKSFNHIVLYVIYSLPEKTTVNVLLFIEWAKISVTHK